MKKYTVTGYKMQKNPNTWNMERIGDLITTTVNCSKNSIEMIEGEVSIQLKCDWFEAVTIS